MSHGLWLAIHLSVFRLSVFSYFIFIFRLTEEKTTTEELIYEDDLDGNSTKRNLNTTEEDIVYEYDYNLNPKPTSKPSNPRNGEGDKDEKVAANEKSLNVDKTPSSSIQLKSNYVLLFIFVFNFL